MDLSTKSATFRDFYRQLTPEAQTAVSRLGDIIESIEKDGISADELLKVLGPQIPDLNRKQFGPELRAALGFLTEQKVDKGAAQLFGSMSASIYDTSPSHLDGVSKLNVDDDAAVAAFKTAFLPDLATVKSEKVDGKPGVVVTTKEDVNPFDAARQLGLLAAITGLPVSGWVAKTRPGGSARLEAWPVDRVLKRFDAGDAAALEQFKKSSVLDEITLIEPSEDDGITVRQLEISAGNVNEAAFISDAGRLSAATGLMVSGRAGAKIVQARDGAVTAITVPDTSLEGG